MFTATLHKSEKIQKKYLKSQTHLCTLIPWKSNVITNWNGKFAVIYRMLQHLFNSIIEVSIYNSIHLSSFTKCKYYAITL